MPPQSWFFDSTAQPHSWYYDAYVHAHLFTKTCDTALIDQVLDHSDITTCIVFFMSVLKRGDPKACAVVISHSRTRDWVRANSHRWKKDSEAPEVIQARKFINFMAL